MRDLAGAAPLRTPRTAGAGHGVPGDSDAADCAAASGAERAAASGAERDAEGVGRAGARQFTGLEFDPDKREAPPAS
jgi:hypothetical protein